MDALTTTEVVALTGLDEKLVRKDVEHNIVVRTSAKRFAEPALAYFLARARYAFDLSKPDRRSLYLMICAALENGRHDLALGPGWSLDLQRVLADHRDRRNAFMTWKERLVQSDDILSGEPVFPNSRLAVRHIGTMLRRGASVEEVREDYPYLTEQDLEFAKLYAVAYPKVGRPRAQGDSR